MLALIDVVRAGRRPGVYCTAGTHADRTTNPQVLQRDSRQASAGALANRRLRTLGNPARRRRVQADFIKHLSSRL